MRGRPVVEWGQYDRRNHEGGNSSPEGAGRRPRGQEARRTNPGSGAPERTARDRNKRGETETKAEGGAGRAQGARPTTKAKKAKRPADC